MRAMNSKERADRQQKLEVRTIILFAIGVFILFLIVHIVGTSEIVPVLRNMDYYCLLLLLGFQILSVATWNLRWNLFVNKLEKVSYFSIMPMLLAGILVNNITPGPSIGGQPLTAYYLKKKIKNPFSECFATLVMDMSVQAFGFAVFGAFSILYVFLCVSSEAIRLLVGILAFLDLLILFTIIFLAKNSKNEKIWSILSPFLKLIHYSKILSRLNGFESHDDIKDYIINQIENLKKTVRELLQFKKVLLSACMLALSMYFLEYMKMYVAFLGLGYSISFVHVVVVASISSTVGYFVFMPGGTGAVETAMVALYFELGIPLGIAATATLLSRLLFYLTTYGAGYISLSYLNLKWN